jgi:hypothetical protein
MARAPQPVDRAFARAWASRLLLAINLVVLAVLVGVFVYPGGRSAPPWDGPAIASVALTAATVVLAGVALGVGVLAIWGYATLREHAAGVAAAAASQAATDAANEAVRNLLKEWGLSGDDAKPDEVAETYQRK